MPQFAVFVLSSAAGRLEMVTAADPEAATAQVLDESPGAVVRAVPAVELEGCNPTAVLWAWMKRAEG